MSGTRSTLLLVGSLCWVLACGTGERGADTEEGASAVRTEPSRERAEAAAAGVVEDAREAVTTMIEQASEAAGRRTGASDGFELAVTAEGLDLPVLRGSSVMATSIANTNVQYTFLVSGGAGSASMALRGGAKDPAGTHDPVSLSILFLEDKLSCGYSSVGGRSDGELAVTIVEKGGGVRGEIAGDVVCRPMEAGASGGPWKGSVEGWFER